MSMRRAFILVSGAIALASGGIVIAVAMLAYHVKFEATQMLVIGGTVMALAIASIWISYVMVQPIRRRLYDIEEAAALIAGGRLYHRVATMGDTDEIGRLAEQFNVMGEKIEQQVGLLQRLADENRELAVQAEQVASLNERQRLARELHDSVSQQLFALCMLSEASIRQLENHSPKLANTIQEVANLANASQREMRALLLHLRPVELEGRSFVHAAPAFFQAISERHGLECSFENRTSLMLSPSIEEHLFRILQEAAANTLKHANAKSIRAILADDGRSIIFTVLDDGIGISTVQPNTADSYGLRAMRERAAGLGGRCEILPRDRGTAVEVRIPIVGSAKGDESR